MHMVCPRLSQIFRSIIHRWYYFLHLGLVLKPQNIFPIQKHPCYME